MSNREGRWEDLSRKAKLRVLSQWITREEAGALRLRFPLLPEVGEWDVVGTRLDDGVRVFIRLEERSLAEAQERMERSARVLPREGARYGVVYQGRGGFTKMSDTVVYVASEMVESWAAGDRGARGEKSCLTER